MGKRVSEPWLPEQGESMTVAREAPSGPCRVKPVQDGVLSRKSPSFGVP